jgi:hypothetical protein
MLHIVYIGKRGRDAMRRGKVNRDANCIAANFARGLLCASHIAARDDNAMSLLRVMHRQMFSKFACSADDYNSSGCVHNLISFDNSWSCKI